MEKRREQGGVLGSVAELFDLPADVVAGLPRLELVGNRELYLEGHTGLLRYSDTGIDANTGFGVLRGSGQRLTLLAMTGADLRIGGLLARGEGGTGCGAPVAPACGGRCGCGCAVPTRSGC